MDLCNLVVSDLIGDTVYIGNILESDGLVERILNKWTFPGRLMTKDNRNALFGSVAGGAGSRLPEEFQRKKIELVTESPCTPTNVRIDLRNHELVTIARPNLDSNGFDISEDFDGVQDIDGVRIYVNLKCVVGKGGHQTRSLREVYWFIHGQLETATRVNVYFANILDGDEAFECMDKFRYALSRPEYANVKYRVYVGDLHGYLPWIKHTILTGEE
jgi:hypothetical protein